MNEQNRDILNAICTTLDAASTVLVSVASFVQHNPSVDIGPICPRTVVGDSYCPKCVKAVADAALLTVKEVKRRELLGKVELREFECDFLNNPDKNPRTPVKCWEEFIIFEMDEDFKKVLDE